MKFDEVDKLHKVDEADEVDKVDVNLSDEKISLVLFFSLLFGVYKFF